MSDTDITDIDTTSAATSAEDAATPTDDTAAAPEGGSDDASNGDNDGENGGDSEPTEASKAIAALGLTRMTLQELKEKSPADLVAFAEKLEIENANSMRKQDMMFAILKTLAEEGVEIGGSGAPGGGCRGRGFPP